VAEENAVILGKMKRASLCLLALFTLLACKTRPSQTGINEDQRSGGVILLDGCFEDWAGLTPVAIDPVGDVALGEIDFSEIKVSNGQDYLYLKIDLGRETIWQNEALAAGGNDVRIYFDAGPRRHVKDCLLRFHLVTIWRSTWVRSWH